jgi:hypothetical protein
MAVEAAAPPAAASPAPAAPPAATPNLIDPLPVPSNPPRPGSARARMQNETGKKWGEEPVKPADEAKPSATTKPAEVPKGAEAATKPADEPSEKTAAEAPADITPDQKKKNPWVLYREEKARAQKLEQQISEAKAASLAETERAQFQERIDKSEAKLKEYEDEIRFKSYEKSDEFKTKYEQPYEKAWEKHVHDLNGVTVLDESGNQRPMAASDILDLVNLSLPDARKLATEKWGDFAQDAMLARKEIRDLFEKKTQALDEARKTGADREKQFEENRKKWVEGVQKQIRETWDTANKAALEGPVNGEFFKPVEGDDTRNQLLGKGFALVDEAFGKNPNDPNLTPEERASIVKKHAAVRNRAAAFGPMKYLIAQLRKKLADLEKTAGELKASTPPAGGGTSAGGGGGAPAGGSARDRMRQAGEKWAK